MLSYAGYRPRQRLQPGLALRGIASNFADAGSLREYDAALLGNRLAPQRSV